MFLPPIQTIGICSLANVCSVLSSVLRHISFSAHGLITTGMERGVGTCCLTATQSAISLTFSRIGREKSLIPCKAADPEEDTVLFDGAQMLFVGIWHSKAFFGQTSQTSFQILRAEIPQGMLFGLLEPRSWNFKLFRSLYTVTLT